MAIGGLYEAAQYLFLQCAQAIYQNPDFPLQSEVGTALDVAVTASYATTPTKPVVVHVGIEGGGTSMPGPYGIVGHTDDGTGLIHRIDITNARAVFNFYTDAEPERRWLADWLPWGLASSYYRDTYGIVFEGYLLTFLRQWKITPRRTPTFTTEPVLPPPDLREQRPFGLPYRAQVKVPFDQQLLWITTGTTFTASATLAPLQGPAFVMPSLVPLRIPIPNSFPHG